MQKETNSHRQRGLRDLLSFSVCFRRQLRSIIMLVTIRALLTVLCLLDLGQLVRPKPHKHSDEKKHDSESEENESEHQIHTIYHRNAQDSCTLKYGNGHTMCMPDNPNVVEAGLKPGDAKFILDKHNSYRGAVEPAPTDLQKLVWDDDLAKLAEKWAKQCVFAHDKRRNLTGPFDLVGQNLARGHRSWADVMEAWYNEIKDWEYGVGGRGKTVGHFTQIVTNITTRVGCGFANCTGPGQLFYVCDYSVGQWSYETPYIKGGRCSACPGRCSDGLCDCNGLICKNRGRLNLAKCECKCKSPFHGKDCSDITCPSKDPAYCYPDICKYSNAASLCPILCGYCKAPA